MKSENISAFMDNEADVQIEKEILNLWRTDAHVRQNWNEYHLIGEVLRERDVNHVDLSNKIFVALAEEPTIFAPVNKRETKSQDSRFAKWVAIAAAIFAVVITTQTIRQGGSVTVNGQIAQNFTKLNDNNLAINDQHPNTIAKDVNSYVDLHRQWSPLTDIQTVDYNSGVAVTR